MTKSKISAISIHLPDKILSDDDLKLQFPDWKIEETTCYTGVRERHISAVGEIPSDLGVRSAEKLFIEHGISPSQIDFLLFCTQSGDYLMPTTACIMQDRLGIPTSAGALDFHLGCTGYVYGLSLAKGLISGGMAKNVLLITAETGSKYIHYGDKANRALFGDGATASLVSEVTGDDTESIGEFIFGTDGSGYDAIILKYGGARFPMPAEPLPDYTDQFGNIRNEGTVAMDGQAIFLFGLRVVPKMIREVLEKNHLSMDDIDHFVFHQASRILLDALKKKMKLPDEKFHYCLEKYGNTVSSSIPIALYEAISSGQIKRGHRILLAGFGVGLSWGATVMKY